MKDPDRQVELTTAHNEPAAGAIVALLDDAGIDAWSRPSDYIGGAVGVFGTLSMTPTTVMVRESDAARARALLEETRSDSVDIDWGEVDVGDEPEPVPGARGERASLSRSSRGVGRVAVWVLLLSPLAVVAYAVVVNAWSLLKPAPVYEPVDLSEWPVGFVELGDITITTTIDGVEHKTKLDAREPEAKPEAR